MLETIREFARNHLADDDVGALLDGHATHFLELAERAVPHLTGPDAGEWLARLDRDHGNFRAALDWVALERSELLPRMTVALWRFWLVRGRFEEGQTRSRAGARRLADADGASRARVPTRGDGHLSR